MLGRLVDRIDIAVETRAEIRFTIAADRGGEVDAVVPDDGAGMTEARDWRLPADVVVFGGVPDERRELAVGDSRGVWAAERGPVERGGDYAARVVDRGRHGRGFIG
jgi:hypothetical protein